jgi:hypothetical protein
LLVGKASLPPGWKMRLVEEKSGVAGSQRVRRTEFMSPAGDVLGSRRGALEYMVRTGCSQVSSGPGHIVIVVFSILIPLFCYEQGFYVSLIGYRRKNKLKSDYVSVYVGEFVFRSWHILTVFQSVCFCSSIQ